MASTYVNDLRLNEMATGDASGSWGTVTNTNLELIGEAFSYGTETIGDADSTLTIADGAADAARSFYLKITSSVDLTTTRIVTLGPNTVSKVWMIENATTGSQVITIKQGSGATINVPNGQVKMISTDGAGSGGAVLDLLVDVDLTGTTTLVNLDVSGAVDIAGDLTLSAGGDGALRFTAASSVKVLDNNAAALVFEEADNAYMTFVTTDGSEAVKFDKALDINAATQIDATVTVGVDDTGYDVKFFGATAGAYMLWDESADDLILGGAAGLSVNSAATVGGTLGVTGVVTANAGVVVDNFTLDGTTLALSSGDLTLDVAGDIILDAGGAQLRFHDDGADIGVISNESNNLIIKTQVSDADILFKGNDGGSTITALTLDMSDAGTAIFNHDITLAANGIFTATSTSSGDYVRLYGSGGTGKWDIYGSGANLRFGDNDTAGYVQIDTRVGIGTASPNAGLQIQGADGSVEATLVLTADGVASAGMACDAGGLVFGAESGDGFQFRTGATAADPTDSGSTIMEITSAGVLQVGEIMEQTAGADINLTMVSEDAGLAIMCRSATDGHSSYITMMKTPATSGNYTATASGDFLGLIEFRGVNTDAVSDVGAMIRVKQTGAESGTVPAEIQFHTKEVSRFVIEDGGEKVMNGATTFAAISAGTASGCSFGDAGDIYSSRATGSSSIHARFFNSTGGATYVGSISTESSSTAYNTSSDYRLKENVNYDWDATTRLKQLKPARFNFIVNPNKTVDGFLAHEAATVVPEAVCGEKDATEMQGIDQSKLVPLLVKTIQELEARITALEA